MGELTSETFEKWLHPSDVIEHYHQNRELNPESLVISLLSDGLLRAAARQLIINGRDHGLSLIPREAWPLAGGTDVWSTGRFRLTHFGGGSTIGISAYDVRIDSELQEAAGMTDTVPTPPRPTGPQGRGGGRPAAAWWDALWIEICRQLYAGDLKPNNQAAIERAMHEWLAAQGHDAGDTTIRTRARLLYQALSSEDGKDQN